MVGYLVTFPRGGMCGNFPLTVGYEYERQGPAPWHKS